MRQTELQEAGSLNLLQYLANVLRRPTWDAGDIKGHPLL